MPARSEAARTRTLAFAIQIALFVAFFGTWWALTASHAVRALFLPSLPAVGAQLGHIVGTPAFWRAVGVTTLSTAEAYAIAVVAGIFVGFVVGRSPRLTAAYRPIFSSFFAIPIALFFPLFVVMLGIGPPSKIAFGALYGFFPIVLNTIAGFSGIDPLFLRSARSQGASGTQMLRRIYLPGALPIVFGGLRIGFFITFASVLGGETLSSAAGVGYAIAHAGELLESASMYAWIAIVLTVTIALNVALTLVERRATSR
jgi:ABC-type nitrate/sulfonate/bicarbonate transport system permease component